MGVPAAKIDSRDAKAKAKLDGLRDRFQRIGERVIGRIIAFGNIRLQIAVLIERDFRLDGLREREQPFYRFANQRVAAQLFGEKGADGGGIAMAGGNSQVLDFLGHRDAGRAAQTIWRRCANGERWQYAFRVHCLQPAAKPAASGRTCAGRGALHPVLGVKMAARRVLEACGVHHGEFARVKKLRQALGPTVKTEISISQRVLQNKAGLFALARNAEVSRAGGSVIFVAGRRDDGEAVGPAAQKDHNKNGIVHGGLSGTEIAGSARRRRQCRAGDARAHLGPQGG